MKLANQALLILVAAGALCLGAPATEADLERALIEIRRILEMAEAISFV